MNTMLFLVCYFKVYFFLCAYNLQNHDMFVQGGRLSHSRAKFFEIVERGLNDRFVGADIIRIKKFCQYAKYETPLPTSQDYMHDPCEEFICDLTTSAWWNVSQFPWVNELEAKSLKISEELDAVLKNKNKFALNSSYKQTMGEGWSALRLQRLGEWNKQNVAIFPVTTQIVQDLNIPIAVRGVMFAKQMSNSFVQPHSDGRNFMLTAHLGVKIPDRGCWISVGRDRRAWEQGKVVVFDTSFTHETGNESNQDRYVLIIDFWHPDLTIAEREALKFVYDARNKFDSGRSNEILNTKWPYQSTFSPSRSWYDWVFQRNFP